MIATILKEGRLAKGFTQKELSDSTNISLRTIQRIESGEVEPRMYSLKVLAETLDIPLEKLLSASPTMHIPKGGTRARKLILSFGITLFLIFISLAYTAVNRFPETHFEASLGIVGLVTVISAILWKIWPTAKKSILSISILLIVCLLAFAFVAQSPSFPETGFEAMLYLAGIVAFTTISLLLIWRKKQNQGLV